jgi:hypothetical protein
MYRTQPGHRLALRLTPEQPGVTRFGAAATLAKLVEFETTTGSANAEGSPAGSGVTPNTRAPLRQKPKDAGGEFMLMGDDNRILRDNAQTSTAAGSTHRVLFGSDWSQLLLVIFGALDVGVDRYTFADSGRVKILVTMHSDFVVGTRRVARLALTRWPSDGQRDPMTLTAKILSIG